MLSTSLTSKGQVTIPIRIRKILGVMPGDKIDFEEKNDIIILRRHENNIQACFGLLKASKSVSLADMDEAIANSAGQ
jgi:antitoxin PrlF